MGSRRVMVKNRHAAPREIAFAAPAGTPSGVEVLSLADLRSRVPPGSLAVPPRLTFHHLLTLTDGSLRHAVDFTDHVLEPGAWLWTRPGQVRQWSDPGRAEGTLVLFEQDFLDAATTTAAHRPPPTARRPPPAWTIRTRPSCTRPAARTSPPRARPSTT